VTRHWREPKTLFSTALLLALLFFALKVFKRQKLLFFSIFWFFITLSLEAFVVLPDVIFEYRLYLPTVGFSIFLSTGAFLILKEPKRTTALLLMISLLFSVATYRRNEVWRDGVTLWKHVVRQFPKRARGYNGMGVAYSKAGEFDQAIAAYHKAIKLNPNYAKAYTSLGAAYGEKGDHDQAIFYLQRAIKINPESVKAFNNLGAVYGRKGDYGKTLEYCQKAVELSPFFAEAHNNLGGAYGRKGDYDQAIASFQKAIALEPQHARAHLSLGFTFHMKGDQANVLKQADRLRALNRNDLADQLEKVSQ